MLSDLRPRYYIFNFVSLGNHQLIALEICHSTIQAIVALTFAQYATKSFFPDCDAPGDAVRLLAAVCLGEFYLYMFRTFR